MVTQEKIRELFNYCPDSGIFTWAVSTCNRVKVGDVAGTKTTNGYMQVMVGGQRYYVHRLIWLYHYKEWPKNQIDHIDGSPDNNRINNLRDVTNEENTRNRKTPNTNISGVIGVFHRKLDKKWTAQITVNDKNVFLGRFHDFFEACCARKSAELKHGYHPNHGRPNKCKS